jgi:hypothetical protein
VTYASALEEAPPELRLPLLRFAEALEEKMRDQLAVRREDFDALRFTVHDLAEAQGRTEGRLAQLEVAITKLAEAQERTEQRVGRLEVALEELAEAQQRTEQRLEQLAEAQQRTEQRLEQLAAAQQRTEQRLEQLAEAQGRTEGRVDELQRAQLSMADLMERFGREQDKQRGDRLERQYREKPFAYFGRLLRRVQVVPLQEIEADLEQRLSEEELDELRPLDLLVRGRPRTHEQTTRDVWLALEISGMVDRNDVEWAQRRGAILRRAGYLAVSGVAGEGVTQGGVDAAQAEKVILIRNGTVQFWEVALAQALAGETSAPGS